MLTVWRVDEIVGVAASLLQSWRFEYEISFVVAGQQAGAPVEPMPALASIRDEGEVNGRRGRQPQPRRAPHVPPRAPARIPRLPDTMPSSNTTPSTMSANSAPSRAGPCSPEVNRRSWQPPKAGGHSHILSCICIHVGYGMSTCFAPLLCTLPCLALHLAPLLCTLVLYTRMPMWRTYICKHPTPTLTPTPTHTHNAVPADLHLFTAGELMRWQKIQEISTQALTLNPDVCQHHAEPFDECCQKLAQALGLDWDKLQAAQRHEWSMEPKTDLRYRFRSIFTVR